MTLVLEQQNGLLTAIRPAPAGVVAPLAVELIGRLEERDIPLKWDSPRGIGTLAQLTGWWQGLCPVDVAKAPGLSVNELGGEQSVGSGHGE